MIWSINKTNKGPGILASIEAKFVWDAFNMLKVELSRFYALRGAALEDVDFDNYKLIKNNRCWSLALIYEGKLYGRINITDIGDERKIDGREWKSFKFWVYFDITKNKKIQIKERNRFWEFTRPKR